ncbi:hypothetical protein ACFW04_014738 [Cataglyphis niger]
MHRMELLLNDKNTYSIVNRDPVRRINNDLRTLITRWRKHDYISAIKSRALFLSDGVLERTPSSFAAFLYNIIFESIPKSSSHVSNSYDLINKLNSKILEKHYQLASLDVISFFTNVSNELAIKGIGRRWHFIEKNTAIPYKEFLAGVRLVLNSIFLKFNGKIYRQTFGLSTGSSMGSPLSPILVDIVLQDLQEKISMLPIKVLLYFRYVDDILFAAPTSFFPTILSSFNSLHKKLQFT